MRRVGFECVERMVDAFSNETPEEVIMADRAFELANAMMEEDGGSRTKSHDMATVLMLRYELLRYIMDMYGKTEVGNIILEERAKGLP